MTEHTDGTFSVTEARMIPGITPLNMVEGDRILVVTAASRFDLLLEAAEVKIGRTLGTRIEQLVAGAARLDRSVIERLLAA